MFVQSNGMVMKGGNIYAAFYPSLNVGFGTNGWVCAANSKATTKMRIGGYNSITDSVIFYSESVEWGRASSMIDSKMSTNPIWFGGVVTTQQSG